MDDARWFERLSRCRCGKPAHGTLRGSRNQSLGTFCIRCADRVVKAANEKRAGGPTFGCCSARKDKGHAPECQHYDGVPKELI